MLDILLFLIAVLLDLYVVTYILTYAKWNIGYQMIVGGLTVVGMAYFVFGVFPHVYQIIVGQLFINPIITGFNKGIRG